MAESHLWVRIRPANKKSSHTSFGYTIRKEDGWCKVPAAAALELKAEKMNELNPETSPPIFDVCTQEEAAALEARERIKVEPRGTADAPKSKVAAPVEEDESMPPAAQARRRGRGPTVVEP